MREKVEKRKFNATDITQLIAEKHSVLSKFVLSGGLIGLCEVILVVQTKMLY